MNKQFKLAFLKIVKFWQGLANSLKVMILAGVAVALVLAISVPFVLRGKSGADSSVLYHNLSSDESSKIYAALQEMSVNVSMNSKGEIIVPAKDVNYLKLQLSTLGYPKSALSYDTFSSNTGFMTTELEKKQYLLMDLQNRLQETIRWIDGVNDAVVTLNVPQESNYIWETSSQQSTGSVMLSMGIDQVISSRQVAAIKNLVASSVPKMNGKDVTVINAATGTEFTVADENEGMNGNLLQLQFEREVEKKMEDKVLNLLTLPYGINNVRVSATVVLDYDKMLQEEMQYIPELDGKGVIETLEEWYSSNKDGVSSGIVGEEDNTDVPTYPQIGDQNQEIDEFNNKAKYLVSYIKKQIERNNAILKSNSISVVVHNHAITDENREALVNTISKAVNVNVADVMINSFTVEGGNGNVITNPITKSEIPMPYVIGAIILGLVLVLIIISLILYYRKKTKQLLLQAEEQATAQDNAALAQLMEIQRNKEREKEKERELGQMQSAKTRETLESIQNFSFANPEIAATLIRDLIREDD